MYAASHPPPCPPVPCKLTCVNTHQVNGFFELSSDRRQIWFGDDLRGEGRIKVSSKPKPTLLQRADVFATLQQSQWNQVLLADVVVPTYARMLLLCTQLLGAVPEYYSLWPVHDPPSPWSLVPQRLWPAVATLPVLHSDLKGGQWVAPNKAVLLDDSLPDATVLHQALLEDGVAVVVVPSALRTVLLAAADACGCQAVTPAYMRNHLRSGGLMAHPCLQSRDTALALLQYCATDLVEDGMADEDHATFEALVGLPLLPLASKELGIIQPATAADERLVMLCNTPLEEQLWAPCAYRMIRASTLPAALATLLASDGAARHTNVRTMSAKHINVLLASVLPRSWAARAEVPWKATAEAGVGVTTPKGAATTTSTTKARVVVHKAQQAPSQEWVKALWVYIEGERLALETLKVAIGPWPVIPCRISVPSVNAGGTGAGAGAGAGAGSGAGADAGAQTATAATTGAGPAWCHFLVSWSDASWIVDTLGLDATITAELGKLGLRSINRDILSLVRHPAVAAACVRPASVQGIVQALPCALSVRSAKAADTHAAVRRLCSKTSKTFRLRLRALLCSELAVTATGGAKWRSDGAELADTELQVLRELPLWESCGTVMRGRASAQCAWRECC